MITSFRPSLVFITLLAMSFTPILRASDPIKVGAAAPSVTSQDQNAEPVDLGKVLSEGITLVYFYPKADTPGCTAQACSLRDDIENLNDLGIRVIGVSRDTPAAQKAFAEKYKLPFTLLADEDGKVSEAFGIGSVLGFSKRSSFLIRDGEIVWVQPKAQTSGHAEEVKAALAEIKK
ncbi:MAG: peroxiredoxin [Chthoniobacterales bacterium]